MDTHIEQQIINYSKELRLPVFRRDFKTLAQQAIKASTTPQDYLHQLMQREYDLRLENRKKTQIRRAGFPSKMYLVDLKRDMLPQDAKQKLPELEQLDFIKTGQNIVLAGNPGTGKTHIATALGLKACQKGYKASFF